MNLQPRLAVLFAAGFLLMCAVGILTPSSRPHPAAKHAVITQRHDRPAARAAATLPLAARVAQKR